MKTGFGTLENVKRFPSARPGAQKKGVRKSRVASFGMTIFRKSQKPEVHRADLRYKVRESVRGNG